MMDGRVQIDGYFKVDLGVGDVFYIRSRPELSLKCMSLIMWIFPTSHLTRLTSSYQ